MKSTKLSQAQKDSLHDSIVHWQKIVKRKEVSNGQETCALCRNYHHYDCKGCPVCDQTGLAYCMGSPFGAFMRSAKNGRVHDEASEAAAQTELQFLVEIWEDRTGTPFKA